jgi:anti-anti-sigma regulatory factor
MAANFTMRFERENGNLHIHLRGDFDGSSAHLLLNAMERNYDNARKIFVDTSGLRRVFSFGREVLRVGLPRVEANQGKIVFNRKDKVTLCPKGMEVS